MEKENIRKGALLVLLAAISYACMGAVVKFLREGSTDAQLVFFRNFLCLVFFLPWIFLHKPKKLKTTVLPIHIVRAFAGLLNMYCFFYSIRYILLSDAMLLNNTMPLFLPLVMLVWQKEKISLKLLPALIIGFIGVVIILKPTSAIFHLGSLLALLSGLFMSISMAGIRELSFIEPIYRILFYYFAISSLVSFIPLFFSWQTPDLSVIILWLLLGLFAALYQFFLTKGYQTADAIRVSPIIYFAVILSGLFDFFFWHQVPDLSSFIGIPVVLIGALLAIRREKVA